MTRYFLITLEERKGSIKQVNHLFIQTEGGFPPLSTIIQEVKVKNKLTGIALDFIFEFKSEQDFKDAQL